MRAILTAEQRKGIKEELALRNRYTIKQILRRYRVSRSTLERLRRESLDEAQRQAK